MDRTLKHRRRIALLSMGLLCTVFTAGATLAGPFGLLGPSGDTNEQQRKSIQQDSGQMLSELYAAKPEMKQKIARAAGYATFKKTDIHLLLVASGNGYGMVMNNKTGRKTYMRVASLGGGVGLGVNDLRVIFVFNDANVMRQFVDQGWQFGANADASAKYEDIGATASQSAKANVNFKDGTAAAGTSSNAGAGAGKGKKAGANVASGGPMEIYQFTNSGIALQATVSGTKYWQDTDLNK